ncbi:MAG: YgeY family selenium metabolism-linked hydrolase [Chloroflexi bacterium HGW-Chloroflexi-2]|jgi:putative selenium metabolism hydrolase|nr:MAG: YgeY family selenium metabolism-linked hydrolase [Chloroflexi bacterium HGW-Chloroflexi-2]
MINKNELKTKIEALADEMNEDMVQFLGDIIRIQSYTSKEGPAVQRTLEELRKIGCDEVWMDSAGNALGRIGKGERIILFNAHLDTNEVSDASNWPHPPLEPVVEDGILYGLGASDCKAGVASIVYGAAILNKLGLLEDVSVVVMGATLEEDAEGFALRSLVERDGLKPECVLLAEATDLTLRRGHRGRCEVHIRTKGKAVHASTPHLGENAIVKMAPVIEALEGMNGHLPVHPVFGPGTQVVSLIAGPHTPNSVPDWCEVALDRRLVPGETAESIVEGIRQVVGPLGASVEIPIQPVKSHTGLLLDGPSFYPGWLIEEDAEIIQIGKEAYEALWQQAPKVDVWKFSTDGTYSAGVAGIPTLGFGPQEEPYVHTAMDQVNLEKLKKAAMFYALYPVIYQEVTGAKSK